MKMMNVSRWMRQRRLSRVVASFLSLVFLVTGYSVTFAQLTDSGIHAPPATGAYGYNSFKPGTAGFPAVGGTYTDPVFGGVVVRLTDVTGKSNQEDIYAHHWSNADGTFAFSKASPGTDIIRVATGTKAYANQPTGLNNSELYWDALDPDRYYYFSGPGLVRRNLAAQTNTVMKTFPSTLQLNGGSLNIQSRDGRYFTVRYGGTNKVWDSQADIIYSGSVTPLSATGWVSITPDGKYLVTAAGAATEPNTQHYSYPIVHGTQSIGSTPTQFWGLCGDHGVLVSASDGKNYFVTFACNEEPGVFRVDISLNQAGRSDQQQRTANQLLLNVDWPQNDGHFSAVSRGAFSDWVFMSVESFGDDNFGSSTSGWAPYKQEIVAMNVVTLEVKRLAHHRSRSLASSYYHQPRVSASWDGSTVLWTSNFNMSSPTGYADMYAIRFPLGNPGAGALPPPTNLRVVQ